MTNDDINAMVVCPKCRAGKQFIDRTQEEDESWFGIEIQYECQRCGHARTERARLA